MRNKLEYVGFSKSIVDNVTSKAIMNADDINPEVLQQVCQMWNTKATINAIQSMLDRNNKCTGEEGEYIVEALEKYESAMKMPLTVAESYEPAGLASAYTGQGHNSPMTPHEVAETLTAIVNSAPVIREVPSTNIAAIIPGFSTEPGTPAPLEKKGRKQTPAVRTTGKTLSAVEIVEKMKEQIACIEYLNTISIDVDSFPSNIGKAAREVLIGFQKELETTKSMAIVAIQQL